MKTMDKILIVIGVFLFLFTAAMIVIFCVSGSVPDTLITCVFAATGGECGIMGWIKTAKDKNQERKWQKEDEENRLDEKADES